MGNREKKKRDYTTVSIPLSLMQRIDKVIEHGKHGYQNRSDLVLEAIRKRLGELEIERLEVPRFKHFNIYEDHVTVMDNKIERLIDVYFRNKKPYCQYCGKHDCIHVRFAVNIPKVYKVLKERGFPIPKDLITEDWEG